MVSASRPRLACTDRAQAVADAADVVRHLGLLDSEDVATVIDATEQAILGVLALSDQLVLHMVDLARLEDRRARLQSVDLPCDATRGRIHNLKAAITVQRGRLRVIGRES